MERCIICLGSGEGYIRLCLSCVDARICAPCAEVASASEEGRSVFRACPICRRSTHPREDIVPERILYSWQLITFIVWAIAGKNYETWKSAVTAISGGALAKEICMNKT